MDNYKYNYIIVGSPGFYSVGYHDVLSLSNVSYHTDYYDGFEGILDRTIVRLNFSKKVNSYIHTPFSWYVYPKLFPHVFHDDKPLCFLFFGGNHFIYQSSYINYIHNKFKKSKIVIFFQDLVARNPYIDMRIVRKNADLLISYDKGDCLKYEMEWHPTPMSYLNIKTDSRDKYDVYFCGYAKTRYRIIYQIYEKLTKLGVKCDFNIFQLPENAPRIDGIRYLSHLMDYEENLKHVVNSNCILEIMQEGADGFTPRLWESIIYDKQLLTNNESIKYSSFYNENFIHYINDITDIHSWINKKVSYDNDIKKSLSPIHLLQYIDSKLSVL